MKIQPFKLERYLAEHEFTAPYLMCCSDCEPLKLKELLALADEESLSLWENLQLGYTKCRGHSLLRQEIAKLYEGLDPGNIVALCPEEGIFTAMNVLLEKGDHVLVTFPCYQSLYEIAASLGCEVIPWLPEEERGWKFDVEFLQKAIKKNTKLIVVNFPHNPTGALLSKGEFLQVVEIAREHDIYLFSDEMYRFLEYDEKDRLPSGVEVYENAVTLFGMSKTFALAGLRLGWLACQNKELIDRFVAFKDYTTICNNAAGEILALMGLRAKEKIINRNLDIIKHNLELLDDFFERRAGLFSRHKPGAGTIELVRFLGQGGASRFCRRMVEEAGVVLLPSSVYNYSDSHFRVGFGRKNLPAALAEIEKACPASY